MRGLVLIVSAALITGCAKKEEPAPEPVAAAPVAPAPIDLTKVAGTWDVKTMGTTSDSVLVTSTLVATADTAGWTLALAKRKPFALSITVSGDSVMASSPEYESALRKGVKVQTNSVYHLVGDQLIGTTTAHYKVTGPDSVLMLRTVGTKAQK
jgi:type IV pilus biogenesis protein CpaD/CtpE